MGLFTKENCCLCGGKTGLFDKKCLSVKVCKDCTKKLSVWFDGFKGADKALLEAFMHTKYEMPDYSYGFKCTPQNWDEIRKYHYYLTMAREIQETITGQRG